MLHLNSKTIVWFSILPSWAYAGVWDVHLLHLQSNLRHYDKNFQKKTMEMASTISQQCKMPVESLEIPEVYSSKKNILPMQYDCNRIREDGFDVHCSHIIPSSIMNIPYFKVWNLGFNEQYYQTLQFKESSQTSLHFQCYVSDIPFEYKGMAQLSWSKESPLIVNTSNGAITAKTKNIRIQSKIPYFNGRLFEFHVLGVAPYLGKDAINLH